MSYHVTEFETFYAPVPSHANCDLKTYFNSKAREQ